MDSQEMKERGPNAVVFLQYFFIIGDEFLGLVVEMMALNKLTGFV